MAIELDVQVASEAADLPEEPDLRRWCELALRARQGDSELTIRLVDEDEGRELNRTWRHKDYATNVLSFPAFDVAPGDALPPMLGDIALAFETCRREAEDKGIALEHHAAHLIVHGLLHLAGHDHEIGDEEAEAMEALETKALAVLGIADPYGAVPAMVPGQQGN